MVDRQSPDVLIHACELAVVYVGEQEAKKESLIRDSQRKASPDLTGKWAKKIVGLKKKKGYKRLHEGRDLL